MRGLTPQEYGQLVDLAAPGDRGEPAKDWEKPILTDLVEQGRASFDRIYGDSARRGRWDITAQGREALKLYPLMLAMQAQP